MAGYSALISKGLLPLMAGGAFSLALPDEAEGAKIPNFKTLFRDRYYNGPPWNMRIGNLEPNIWKQVQEVSPPNAKNNVVASPHAVESRREKDGWSPERTIDAMGEVLDDNKNGVVVKNWQPPDGKGPHADYGIMMPFEIEPSFTPFFTDKKGNIVFKTTFPPNQGNLKEAGFGVEGGKPLISRDHSELKTSWPGTQPQPISVVTSNNPAMGNTLADLTGLGKWKKKAVIGTGTGAALYPSEAEGVLPADPTQYGGLMGYVARDGKPAGNPIQNELFSAVHDPEPVTWEDVKHGLSFGTRGVMEGVLGAPASFVNMVSEPLTGYSFPNIGATAANALGLDLPQNDEERIVYGLSKGASEAIPYVAGGGALAKGGAGAVRKFGEYLADHPRAQAILGGMMGLLGGGE